MNTVKIFYPFIVPKDLAATYRLDFKNGYFYIGCSSDLRKRVIRHLYNVRNELSCFGWDFEKKGKLVLDTVTILKTGVDIEELWQEEKRQTNKVGRSRLCLNVMNTTQIIDTEVITRLAEGDSIIGIAKKIKIPNSTLDYFVTDLKKRLGFSTNTGLIMHYVRNGLIDIDSLVFK